MFLLLRVRRGLMNVMSKIMKVFLLNVNKEKSEMKNILVFIDFSFIFLRLFIFVNLDKLFVKF